MVRTPLSQKEALAWSSRRVNVWDPRDSIARPQRTSRKTDRRTQSDVRWLSWIPFFSGGLSPRRTPGTLRSRGSFACAHSLGFLCGGFGELATKDRRFVTLGHAREYDHRDSRLFRSHTHLLDEIEPRRLSGFLQDRADVDQHAVAVDLNPGRQ